MTLLLAGFELAAMAVQAVLAVGLAAAAYFLQPKAKRARPRETDLTLPNLATQGSYVPLLYGRRRVGAVIAWVGDRRVENVRAKQGGGGFGKGGGGKVNTGEQIYYESAWHLLCVGPASRLNRMWAQGRLIWDTPITPDDTPSGSLLHDFDGNAFVIRWGEPDQPVDEFLADESRVGAASRWPHVCSITWVQRALGNSPQWATHEYDVEVGTEQAAPVLPAIDSTYGPYAITNPNSPDYGNQHLFAGYLDPPTEGTHEGTVTLPVFEAGWYGFSPLRDKFIRLFGWSNTVPNPPYSNTHGALSTATSVTLRIDDEIVYQETSAVPVTNGSLPPGWTYLWIGAGYGGIGYAREAVQVLLPQVVVWLEPGDHEVKLTVPFVCPLTPPHASYMFRAFEIEGQFTFVKFTGPIETPPQRVSFEEAVTRLLGATYPHGGGFDLAHVDQAALQQASSALDSEGLIYWCVLAQDGEELASVVATLLQDAGVLWLRDPTRLIQETFRLVREEPEPLPEVVADMLQAETEVEVVHADRPADRLLFSFPDVERQFRDSVISIGDDGQPYHSNNVRGQAVTIAHLIHMEAAGVVAERRSQEELGGGARYLVHAGRDARLLVPGQAIRVAGVAAVLRVTEVEADPLTSRTRVTCLADHYGAPASGYEHPQEGAGDPGGSGAPAANLAESWLEIPEAAGVPGRALIAALRLRAHEGVAYQIVHASTDGTTYKRLGLDSAPMAGGALTEALPLSGWEIEDGPAFDALGPDMDTVQDLSSDEAAWRRGQQIAVIGGEVCFVRGVEALGGGSWRLKGLIRARYDTDREAHAIGAPVFVFPDSGLVPFGDAMFTRGASLRVKQQPVARGALGLDEVAAVTRALHGKGVVLPPVVGLSVAAPMPGVPAYESGDDVRLVWASRLAPAGAGAGLLPAGEPLVQGVLGLTTVYEIRVYDSGDDLVRTDVRSLPEWTYANDDLQDDLGGETAFRVEVREYRSGHYSDPASMLVEVL
ncbi:MAG: hypothetical protein KIT58_00175 [Planctomycetota bacterium]|nr:hypothetical protein [Planctomycetota bacterium]